MRSSCLSTIATVVFAAMSVAAPVDNINTGIIDTALVNSALPLQMKPTIGGGSAAMYDGILHDTHEQVFYLSVRSDNKSYSGHNIQLAAGNPASFAVVDKDSPVLLATLQNGTLASAAVNKFNQPYLLGGIAGLRNVTSNSTVSAQSFIFRNGTASAAPVFKESAREWYLLGGGYTPTYGLYQKVASGWVNGFIICDMGEEVYQLFYYEYTGLIPDFGETCEFVMLQATLGPYE